MDGSVTRSSPDEKVHLLDYVLVLAKHSRMIISISAAATVLTCLFLFLFPNKYTATACLIPPQQNLTLSAQLLESLGGSASALPTSASGLGGSLASMLGLKSIGDIYVGMMTHNTVCDSIIERFKLREVYHLKYIEDVRKKLKKRSEINVGNDGLITVEVTDEDPQRAAEMANAFMEGLDRLLQKMARREALDRTVFLEKERIKASHNLTKAEETLRTFSEKSSVIQIDAQTKGVLEYIANLRATIDLKEVELQVLRQKATPLNYNVINLETELKSLKQKLRGAETQADQSCLGEVCLATSKVPSLGLEYLRLHREVKFQEGLYQLYCKLLELARLDEVREVAVVQIVDRATPPEKKSGPKRLIISLIVGMVTFFMMIFVAFVREFWQNISTSESDAHRLEQLFAYMQYWRQDAQRLLSVLKRKKP